MNEIILHLTNSDSELLGSAVDTKRYDTQLYPIKIHYSGIGRWPFLSLGT